VAIDRWEEVKRLFHEALEREPSRRSDFLDGLGTLNPSLRKEVESLLASHDKKESFLNKPPIEEEGDSGAFLSEDTASVTRAREIEEAATEGRQIGPYRLLQELGHGGMGVVYEAEQEKPVHRRVALKLIKLGMDTKQVIARFESERQALALMNHPNIASVYDAGATEQGRPYFAMEYVQGIPIAEYCDKHRLRIKERLELFIAVCEGVQHAHQKGIIHRDLKPSNVLVTIQDDKPVPKIIDFGVAKATAHRLTERTVYTELGQLIGTPAYMSPEQAEMTGLDIDTRTDVYSLGVILYELLVGAQPFDATELRKAGFEGVRRIIRDKEPLKPSTKVQSLSKTPTDSAKNRSVEPPAWERELRGDLDWITMKALEKDRTRRYGSPSDLAADIARHLKHEPVLAGPPSTIYKVMKFVRRHRVGVASAAVITFLLVALLVGMTIQAARIARARDRAESEAAKAQSVNEFLRNMLSSVDPWRAQGEVITVHRVLDEASAQLREDATLDEQPEVEAAIHSTIGHTYLSLGDYEAAEPHIELALKMNKNLYGEEHVDVATSLQTMAWLKSAKGDSSDAERLTRERLALERKLHGEKHERVADAMNELAMLLRDQHELEEAEMLIRGALEMLRELLGPEHLDVANSLTMLGSVLDTAGKNEEALRVNRKALELHRKLLGNRHPLIAIDLNNIGLSSRLLGNYDLAIQTLRESLALSRDLYNGEHSDLVYTMANLALALRGKGDLVEAESIAAEAVGLSARTSGGDHRKTGRARLVHGTCLLELGRYKEAETELVEAYRVLSAAISETHPRTLDAARNLAELYEKMGNLEKAAEYRAMLAEK
jgi:serine/threonine protein kinase/tetratricopeptide (TPR) repeat protein